MEVNSFHKNGSIPDEKYSANKLLQKTRRHFQMTQKNWDFVKNLNLKPAAQDCFREQFFLRKKNNRNFFEKKRYFEVWDKKTCLLYTKNSFLIKRFYETDIRAEWILKTKCATTENSELMFVEIRGQENIVKAINKMINTNAQHFGQLELVQIASMNIARLRIEDSVWLDICAWRDSDRIGHVYALGTIDNIQNKSHLISSLELENTALSKLKVYYAQSNPIFFSEAFGTESLDYYVSLCEKKDQNRFPEYVPEYLPELVFGESSDDKSSDDDE